MGVQYIGACGRCGRVNATSINWIEYRDLGEGLVTDYAYVHCTKCGTRVALGRERVA